MDANYFQKIKDIFDDVVDISPERRDQFLHEKCGKDHELLTELQSLLDIHDGSENLLEANALDLKEKLAQNGKSYQGREFGHYTILREIGHGGMGAVFLAERNDGEFDQQVALKIVRQTIVSNDIERHFRRERQILASLNHPNIAKLVDGGVSSVGEPFLAMEYIDGVNLLEFAGSLSINEKLRLFLKICDALEYAHRNLIAHLDMKPSNILVTKQGEPKLLDFGLAKMQDNSFSLDTTQTIFRALTPAYASPEQLKGSKVSTASDIYSLGVVFYEFLSGEKPFDFENKGLEEILRTITNEEPRRLSQVRSAKLQSQALTGDLENIAAKALAKEPERRYSSVGAFADDIEKYLKGLPVSARPNTFTYRASKFLRRHKLGVTAAIIILAAIMTAGVVSFVQFRKAQTERAKAEEVKAFLVKMLFAADPGAAQSNSKGYSTTVDDMLSQAAQRLDSNYLSGQPEVKGELEMILGRTYSGQGQYDRAEKFLRNALETVNGVYPKDKNKILQINLSLAHLSLAKGNYDDAEKGIEQSLPTLREECRLGNIDFNELVWALNDYALIRRARGDSKQAEALYRENLTLIPQNEFTSRTLSYARTMISLTEFDQGKFDEAETEVRQLIAELDQQPADGDGIGKANALTLLGSILTEKGELNDASDSLRQGESAYRGLLSPGAIILYDNLRLQAQVAYLSGDYPRAKQLLDQVMENYQQNSNPKYISFATALTLRGLIVNKLGKGSEAETILRRALSLRIENLPPKHFLIALTKGALGEVLTVNRKYAEAEQLLRESDEELKVSQASANRRTQMANARLQDLYRIWSPGSATK